MDANNPSTTAYSSIPKPANHHRPQLLRIRSTSLPSAESENMATLTALPMRRNSLIQPTQLPIAPFQTTNMCREPSSDSVSQHSTTIESPPTVALSLVEVPEDKAVEKLDMGHGRNTEEEIKKLTAQIDDTSNDELELFMKRFTNAPRGNKWSLLKTFLKQKDEKFKFLALEKQKLEFNCAAFRRNESISLKENNTRATEMADIKNQLEKEKQLSMMLQINPKSLDTKMREGEEMLQKAEAGSNDKVDEIKLLEAKLEDADGCSNRKDSEIRRLRSELSQLVRVQQLLEEAHNDTKQLKEKIDDLEENKGRLKHQVSALEKSITENRRSSSSQQAALELRDKEISNLKGNIDQLVGYIEIKAMEYVSNMDFLARHFYEQEEYLKTRLRVVRDSSSRRHENLVEKRLEEKEKSEGKVEKLEAIVNRQTLALRSRDHDISSYKGMVRVLFFVILSLLVIVFTTGLGLF